MNGFYFNVGAADESQAAESNRPGAIVAPPVPVPGYDPFCAWQMATLSALAYRSDDYIWANIGHYFLEPLIDCAWFDRSDTQAFIAVTNSIAVIVFRGTESLEDVVTDIECDLVQTEHGCVHRGFLDALDSVWNGIVEHLASVLCGQTVFLTGHSLGAAVATLAAYRLKMMGIPVGGLYTYGSPRVGDKTFAEYFSAALPDTYRHVNNNDIVCRVPLLVQQYRHVGHYRYIDQRGRLYDQVSGWQRLWFWASGIVADLGKPGIDSLKDHGIAGYESRLRALFLHHRRFIARNQLP